MTEEHPVFAFTDEHRGHPEPGTDCPECGRRVPHPKKPGSPRDTNPVSFGRLPSDRHQALKNGLETLAEYTGATQHKYPQGKLLEALLLLGGQHREELREWMRPE